MTNSIGRLLDDAKVLLAEHPAMARSSTIARAELTGAVGATVRVGRYTFDTDEPVAAGGGGSAPSPVQYAVGALAACEVVTYRYWSELLDTPLHEVAVEVRAEGDLSGFLGFDPVAPIGFSRITITTELRGPSTAAQYEALHARVLEHCPVLVAFRGATPIESHLTTVSIPTSTR